MYLIINLYMLSSRVIVSQLSIIQCLILAKIFTYVQFKKIKISTSVFSSVFWLTFYFKSFVSLSSIFPHFLKTSQKKFSREKKAPLILSEPYRTCLFLFFFAVNEREYKYMTTIYIAVAKLSS